MTNRALIFVESSTSGHLFVRAARSQGFQPILVTTRSDRYGNLAGEPVGIVLADTSDVKAMASVCQKLQCRHPIAGIISTSGAYATMAATLCQLLGLPGEDPRAIDICQNKFSQRETLRAAGLLSPAYRLVHDVPSSLKAADQIGFPVIVKPVIGSGSTGVRLCLGSQEVAAQVREILSLSGGQSAGVLIEEFIKGLEYSVETIGNVILGITKKHLGGLPHFVEVGHDFPAVLANDDRAAIKSTVLSALKALNLSWGPAHTELRLDKRGPVIIEVNPRMGGDMIPELVRLASGVDVVAETIKLVTGVPMDLTPQARRQASIRFLNPSADGFVRWNLDPNSVQAMPAVSEVKLYVADGDKVRRQGDYRDRIGHVIVVGQTHRETEFTLAAAMAMLRYDISPTAG